MKSRLFVVVDKDNQVQAASFARPGASFARPLATEPGHKCHEIEVSEQLAAEPTFEAVKAAVAKHLGAHKDGG